MVRKKTLPVLLAAVAILLSFSGAAIAAEPTESVSDEQIAGAVQRIMENRYSAEDRALVKRFPEIARQVPAPDGVSVTVSAGTGGGAPSAAAENCLGWIAFDLTVVSEANTVIYTWRHYITACSDGTNVTRFLSRYDYLVRTNGQVAFKEPPVINTRGITPYPHTWSHIQRRVVYCVNLTTQDRCSESLPWSRIHLYQDHTWNAEWEGGWYPNNRGRVPF